MIDGYKAFLLQALHLHSVMDDVTKTIKRLPFGKFLLRFLYRGSNAEAEATAIINLYVKFACIHNSTAKLQK